MTRGIKSFNFTSKLFPWVAITFAQGSRRASLAG